MKVDTLIFKKIAYTQAKKQKKIVVGLIMSLLVSPCFCAKLFFFIPGMIESCIVEIVER